MYSSPKSWPVPLQFPWSAPKTETRRRNWPAWAAFNSVHPPGPGKRHAPLTVAAANDHDGAQRIFTTLVPAAEKRTTTALGLSAVTEAGALANPWLPRTRHSRQFDVCQTSCNPATAPERSRAASAVAA